MSKENIAQTNKRVIAWQLAEAMKAKHISRREMAKRMATSRTQIKRLFDPENDRVQLDTIQKAAAVLGKRVNITFEDVAAPDADKGVKKNSGKRGRKPDPYIMWLSYQLACVVDETTDFLPQHKQVTGAYVVAGKRLHLSPEAVERHVRNAQKLRYTEEGLREYHEWLNLREKQWWFYQAKCVENKNLDAVRIPSTVIEGFVDKAKKRLKDEGKGGEEDYKEWLARYKRRAEKGQSRFLVFRPLRPDDPAAMAIDERRTAKGLRNGLTKAGRKRIK